MAQDGTAACATIREALDELARIDAAAGVKPGGKVAEPAVVRIKPEGWHDWGKDNARACASYGGAALVGPGAECAAWPEWTHELAGEELARFDARHVLGAWDGAWVAAREL